MSIARTRAKRIVHVAILAGFAVLSPAWAAPTARIILAEAAGVTVSDAWARATAGASANGAAYVMLMGGPLPDRLVAVSTPVAAAAQVHDTVEDHGVMRMRPVAEVPIPPNGMVTFAPGGLHIMLTGLKQPLIADQSFPLTLTFAHAATVTVDVKIRPLGSRPGHDAPADGSGDMKM